MVPVVAWLALGLTQLAPSAPVSQAEAYKVLVSVQNAMSDALHTPHIKPPHIKANSNSPLQREVLLDEFKRIADAFKPAYKLRPRAQYLDAQAIKVNPKRRPEALQLVKLGFVDTLSPVLVGPTPNLSVQEFSQAVAYFMERWADRTHLPSAEYSPSLMPDPPVKAPTGAQSSGRPVPAPAKPAQHPA